MPKTKVLPLPPEDVPIWDALVAELGDPRPYEPSTIGEVVVTDEPCVDEGGFDDLSTDLDDEVERFRHLVDELTLEARGDLDRVFPLDDVDDALERRAWHRHARLRTGQTVVIPVWPIEEVAP